ncbi:MAG: hypothetical protein MRY63_09345 [Neomegalonema sp.]|nr:hypothetical protein [Neomegalonema sp.]
MALEGDYLGLLDGRWGQRSQQAFLAFRDRQNLTSLASAYTRLIDLNQMASARYDFRDRRIEAFGVSLLVPTRLLGSQTDPEAGEWIWKSSDGSLLITLQESDMQTAQYLHESAGHGWIDGTPSYQLRQPARWVTSGSSDRGEGLYLRSDQRGEVWSTLAIRTIGAERLNRMRVISSSYWIGPPRAWVRTE